LKKKENPLLNCRCNDHCANDIFRLFNELLPYVSSVGADKAAALNTVYFQKKSSFHFI